MKHGFLKVAAACPNVTVANCNENVKEMITLAESAYKEGVRILVFPELSITGYTCADIFYSELLIKRAEASLATYLTKSKIGDMISIIGLPLFVNDKIYNCAAFCQNKQILGVVPKINLQNHSGFCESRYFAEFSGTNKYITLCETKVPFGNNLIFACKTIPSLKVGIEICEDLFATVPPSAALCKAGATVIANPSASNELVGKDDYRRLLVQSQSARALCGYIFANAYEGESTTDCVFSGHSIIAENGNILAERMPFDTDPKRYTVTEIDLQRVSYERRTNNTLSIDNTDDFEYIEFSLKEQDTTLTRVIEKSPFVAQNKNELMARCERILDIQARGLAQRFTKSYSKSCVIGISGGLDSCLAMLVAAKAMDILARPRTDVLGVTMPCFGTTNRTKSNAEILCNELGVSFKCVDISSSVRSHFNDIGHDESVKNVVYENAQARERTQVLMDIANMCGGIVVGTGDLSELALGWATYNGDHMSMYGVNGGVPKTLIRHIVAYCADLAKADGKDTLSKVLLDILDTPVSPELLPANDDGKIAQITEDIVGPYELHDFYLFYMLRYGMSPDKLLRLAEHAFKGVYDRDTLIKWLENFVKRFFAQQFKRSCLPDGPKVGSVSVSPRGDLKMPSDASSAEWLAIIDQLKKQ